MKKEDILVLAQLLMSIKDCIKKIEEAKKNDDAEQLAIAKKEILNFQRRIGEIL